MCIDVRYGNMYVHVIQINARLTYMRIYIYTQYIVYPYAIRIFMPLMEQDTSRFGNLILSCVGHAVHP